MKRFVPAMIVPVLALLLLPVSLAFAARPVQGLSIGNNDFSSTILFDGRRIGGVEMRDALGHVITSEGQEAVFELCVNSVFVSSSDPVWRFESVSRDTLSNGGVVATFVFKGRGKLGDLVLAWDREYFPTGAFVRERLRLSSGREAKMRLSDCDGRNHLVFPRYSFENEGSAQAKEIRIAGFRKKRAFPDHHIFHPDSSFFSLDTADVCVKGPFLVVEDGAHKFVTSYEHASHDYVDFKTNKRKGAMGVAASKGGNDAAQGVEGETLQLTDDDLWFISSNASASSGRLLLWNSLRHGGYLDGEEIPCGQWYETVWSTLSVLAPESDENEAIREYLFSRITENAQSRIADFYYNSWGMQRQSGSLYDVMNEERLKEEMRYAAECGATTFVVDDGWHETFGHWVCNPERIPSGLGALCAYMDSLGLRPGIWLSLPGAGAATQRALEHPEWLIRDLAGEPLLAQWRNPVYDLVGPYYDELLGDLKALCDLGFRFFKWDAMNIFSSTLPGLWHGSDAYSERERADRYNYLLPFMVTRLMRELREYCPGVVIENDLTEPERCMMGLMPLQEGKFYFNNNGSSKYGDYSPYRSKSMRAVINEFAPFFPQELFTYAFYPMDAEPWFAEEYNVTSALSAGHGIWGNLALTTPSQRSACKSLFDKASKVLPHIAGRGVEVSGAPGSSFETYVQRDSLSGFALVTAFGSSYPAKSGPKGYASALPLGVDHVLSVAVDTSAVLGVLGCPFRLGPDGVELSFSFDAADNCASAFVLGIGGGEGEAGLREAKNQACAKASLQRCGTLAPCVRVVASTGKLESIEALSDGLAVTAATDAEVTVALPDGTTKQISLSSGDTVKIR